MIEATSIAHVKRAPRTRAAESGEDRCNAGDQVEIHRPPSTRDASDWAGLRTVMSADPARGKVAAKYRLAEMACRLQDARAFTGAVFDEMGIGMARADLAWDRA
eukprot:7687398-Pyramimonas_sp.AAC.1